MGATCANPIMQSALRYVTYELGRIPALSEVSRMRLLPQDVPATFSYIDGFDQLSRACREVAQGLESVPEGGPAE